MACLIEVSEVGPAEFPLLEVLRDTIFGEFGHVSRASIATSLADRPDLLVLIAHLEGNPVGFSAGYRRKPGCFYINYMAILRDYRKEGIGRRMMERQEAAARAGKYIAIEFNTFNHFPGMLRLGLSMGYRPIGIEQHLGTDFDLAIRFGKALESPLREIDRQEIARVRAALESGQEIVGVMRDPQTNDLTTLLRPAVQSGG